MTDCNLHILFHFMVDFDVLHIMHLYTAQLQNGLHEFTGCFYELKSHTKEDPIEYILGWEPGYKNTFLKSNYI